MLAVQCGVGDFDHPISKGIAGQCARASILARKSELLAISRWTVDRAGIPRMEAFFRKDRPFARRSQVRMATSSLMTLGLPRFRAVRCWSVSVPILIYLVFRGCAVPEAATRLF